MALVCPPQDYICQAAQKFTLQTAKCASLVAQTGNAYPPWVRHAQARDQVMDLTGKTKKQEQQAADIFKLRHRRVSECMMKEIEKWTQIGEEFDRQRARRWPAHIP